MTIQVTLHVKCKDKNLSVQQAATYHRMVEAWAQNIALRPNLITLFDVHVIDVFNVNGNRTYIDNPNTEGPF